MIKREATISIIKVLAELKGLLNNKWVNEQMNEWNCKCRTLPGGWRGKCEGSLMDGELWSQ